MNRRKGKRSLSDIELTNLDDYERMQNGGLGVPPTPPRRGGTQTVIASIGSGECWCGQNYRHDGPHTVEPRPTPPPALGHQCILTSEHDPDPFPSPPTCIICGHRQHE